MNSVGLGVLIGLAAVVASIQAQLNPVVETTPSCSSGSAAMILMSGRKIPGKGKSIKRISLDDCSQLCRQNKDAKNRKLECSGFNYVANTETCVVFKSYDPATLQPVNGTSVYQKTCVTSNRICASPFLYEMNPQKILVGFAREVRGNIESPQACLEACLNSVDELEFECESVMYYPADQECILNTEDRRDRPELFVDEADDAVIYFDNNCAGSQCYAPAVTQYIKVADKKLASKPDILLKDQTLDSCAYICDKRLSDAASDFSCKSFSYSQRSQECALSDERSLPLGRDELVDAAGSVYYEKKCFESKKTCRNVGAFDRVPQMILVGFAAFVLENINSVTKCLDACVSPPPETGEGFVCSSVMYYYNEQECILNTETRASQPDLFIPEGEGFQVDYFDIACEEEEKCRSGKPNAIRNTKRRLAPVTEATQIAVTSGSPQQCVTACFSVSPQKCRSFNYANGKCTHLIVNSDTGVLEKGGQSYELICLSGACTGEAAAFDRVEMKKRREAPNAVLEAINSLHQCLNSCLKEGCSGVNYNVKSGACEMFGEPAQGSRSFVSDDAWDYYESNCVNTQLPVNKPVDEVQKTTSAPAPAPTRATAPSQPQIQANLDEPGIKTICDFSGMKVLIAKEKTFSGAFFVKNKYETCKVEVANANSAMLDLGFPTGLQQIGGPLPPGVPLNAPGFFVHHHHRAKRQAPVVPAPSLVANSPAGLSSGGAVIRQPSIDQFGKAQPAPNQAVIPPTGANVAPPPTVPIKDCGVSDLKNGSYSATVVVQTNNFGIPGLVTSMDEIYTVSCDYSNMMGEGAQAEAKLKIDGMVATDIRPQGKIELSSPVMMQMLSAGGPDSEQTPMIRAEIGDMLELRWNMMAFDDSLDFFVRECTAEKGGPPDQSDATTLKLIERGCPTPAVAGILVPEPVKKVDKYTKSLNLQAFRFDGSRTVRVICQLDICNGDCNPSVCDIKGDQVESFGRKKRDVFDNIVAGSPLDKIETGKYIVPKRVRAVASVMITEKEKEAKMEANYNAHRDNVQSVQRPGQIHESTYQEAVLMDKMAGKVCLPRSTFLGVFLFLGGLCLIQAIFVAVYATKRFTSSSL